ncbi:MAG: 50S ribosomal protein L1 [Myxococcota bacterium]
MKRGKRYAEAAKRVQSDNKYEPAQACELIQQTKGAQFDESVDIAVNLGVDPRHADQQVRGMVQLPNGTGKTVRVAVFAKHPLADEAKKAGADEVGAEDLVQRVQGGFLEFDKVVSAPDMMPQVGKLGRVLGPRGLMPNPKLGTVTADVAAAVTRLKAGQVEFRVDKQGLVHSCIGRASFDQQKLLGNLKAFLSALIKAKPQAAKGQYVKRVALACTMGPGIRLDVHKCLEFAAGE